MTVSPNRNFEKCFVVVVKHVYWHGMFFLLRNENSLSFIITEPNKSIEKCFVKMLHRNDSLSFIITESE